MLLEAKNCREQEQNPNREEIKQKVLNMGALYKLLVGVDEVECSEKSGRMSLRDLSSAIEQTVVLMSQAHHISSWSQINVDVMYWPHSTRSSEINIYPTEICLLKKEANYLGGGDISRSSGVHPAIPPRKKSDYRKSKDLRKVLGKRKEPTSIREIWWKISQQNIFPK